MSLLLEALKKAERSKHEPALQAPGDAGKGELSLMDPSPEPVASRDNPGRTAGRNSQSERGREEADNLFGAKQAASGSRKLVLGALVALLVVAAAGGTYVWYQISRPAGMQARTGTLTPAQTAAAPAAQGALPAVPPAPPAEPPAGGREAGAAPTQSPPGPATAPAAAALPDEPAARETPPPPRPRAAPRARSETVATAPSPGAVTIKRTQSLPQVDPDIASGYESLRAGNAAAAQESYTRALRRDPQNRDVLLGLAAVAQVNGNPREAQRLYQRILELDPRDPVANAALLALRPQGDPGFAESRIKTLISQHPDSPVLHFALGNYLAGRARWAEAQQAYFRAHSLDPANADYAFNTAVSLDHLGQRRLAEDYYNRAIALASGGPVNFDRAQAAQRVQEIGQSR